MGGEWQAAARESYDRVAEPYAEATRAAVVEDPYLRARYRTLAELCRAAGGSGRPTIVDVGCGPGWWLAYLADLGVSTIGIDIAPRMVDLARRNAPQAACHVGSILRVPLPTGSADGAVCQYVLHHVPDDDLDRAVDELVRLLRPGGVLLLGGHIGDSRRTKTDGYGGLPMDVQINRRPAPQWADMLAARGLRLEAHTVFEPAGDAPTHALFARKTGPPTL